MGDGPFDPPPEFDLSASVGTTSDVVVRWVPVQGKLTEHAHGKSRGFGCIELHTFMSQATTRLMVNELAEALITKLGVIPRVQDEVVPAKINPRRRSKLDATSGKRKKL